MKMLDRMLISTARFWKSVAKCFRLYASRCWMKYTESTSYMVRQADEVQTITYFLKMTGF